MALNNTVTLTGNLGSEARIIANEENTFAAVSLATTDSYKDEQGEWHDKQTVWHNILAFSPRVIEKRGVELWLCFGSEVNVRVRSVSDRPGSGPLAD